MNHFMLLQINLLNEGELKVLFLKIPKILCDNHLEISILFVFELNNPAILDEIVEQLEVFTTHLDSTS